jgi:dienelactone hydrolase
MRCRPFVLGEQAVRIPIVVATLAAAALALPPRPAAGDVSSKRWCAPEVAELSDHVCFFDGTPPDATRRTLVVYLHGMLATTPGFQYVQQRALAREAKALGFTVLFPTSPLVSDGYYWPTSAAAQREQEPALLAGLERARRALADRLGRSFDETFVVGFSSGAYYASSLALRGAIDVDGYIVLAGGSSWARPADRSVRRAPVFVGVSAADRQTAAHSRALAGTLSALRWPARVEERGVGHLVDETFLAHGLAWLRTQKRSSEAASATLQGEP